MTTCMRCQSLFSEEKKKEKNIASLLSPELAQGVVKVKSINNHGNDSQMHWRVMKLGSTLHFQEKIWLSWCIIDKRHTDMICSPEYICRSRWFSISIGIAAILVTKTWPLKQIFNFPLIKDHKICPGSDIRRKQFKYSWLYTCIQPRSKGK